MGPTVKAQPVQQTARKTTVKQVSPARTRQDELAELGRQVRQDAVVSDTVADFTFTADGDLLASRGWLAEHTDVELGQIYKLCS